MGTKWLDTDFVEFVFHKQTIVVESGYNYFLYTHPRGQIAMMRISEDNSETLYADGGFNKTSAWTNRASLNYKYYDELA